MLDTVYHDPHVYSSGLFGEGCAPAQQRLVGSRKDKAGLGVEVEPFIYYLKLELAFTGTTGSSASEAGQVCRAVS